MADVPLMLLTARVHDRFCIHIELRRGGFVVLIRHLALL